MPKLIDYPRTTYTGAWELAEVTDDTGGKCAIETAARKLNRKVSGSFKAIIGSAVKFGLLTSKRDLLTTTTLFKRIKHAYDKQEELLFHREAFLTPPLFTQICRKFRSRELPVQMLDVMLIREFGVEEINAQGVAKAFVEGSRMVGLLDDQNIMADIDALANQKSPRRELASPQPSINTFRNDYEPRGDIFSNGTSHSTPIPEIERPDIQKETINTNQPTTTTFNLATTNHPAATDAPKVDSTDAIASLFGLVGNTTPPEERKREIGETLSINSGKNNEPEHPSASPPRIVIPPITPTTSVGYQIQISGVGINTSLSITEEEDIALAVALLEKIRRQLKT
ncbi:hypothetical protein [Hymenobacter terrenus]|uniref:hypothetical protein n=1 Tax=Hymenobacter terrenus TaxID=1629124 RepID=UPI000A99886E|nr:hypothetical protein [Hymenobacter terrenus]